MKLFHYFIEHPQRLGDHVSLKIQIRLTMIRRGEIDDNIILKDIIKVILMRLNISSTNCLKTHLMMGYDHVALMILWITLLLVYSIPSTLYVLIIKMWTLLWINHNSEHSDYLWCKQNKYHKINTIKFIQYKKKCLIVIRIWLAHDPWEYPVEYVIISN